MKDKILKVLNAIYFIIIIITTASFALALSMTDTNVQTYGLGHTIALYIIFALIIVFFWWTFIEDTIKNWQKSDIPTPTTTPPDDRETSPYTRREWYQIGFKDGYNKALKDVGYKK